MLKNAIHTLVIKYRKINMKNGHGTRYNADVHNALAAIKKYNAGQEIDEAPYGALSNVKDTARRMATLGFGKGARMAKGRKSSGKIANQINKEWEELLGKKGYDAPEQATVQDMRDYIEQLRPGTDADAFFKKAGVTATTPTTTLMTKSQDAILLALGQALNQQGGASTGASTGAPARTAATRAADAGSLARAATAGSAGAAGAPGAPGTPGADGAEGEPGTPGADGAEGGEGEGGEPLAIDTDGDGTADPGSDPSVEGDPLPEPAPGSEEIPDGTKVADPTGNPGPTGTKGSGKGKEWWWKEPRDRWQDKKSRTPGSERHVDRLTKQATADLGGGAEAPDAKQTELIDFVSNLKDAQKKELRGYIRNAMSSRAQKVGH